MSLNVRTEQVGLEESIQSVVRRINRRGLSVKIRSSDFTQPLGRITQQANEFTKSLEASNARVIAFGASAAIIGGVTRGFTELVGQAIKVEKVLTDINVVLGTTASNLSKFGDSLFKVARNTSQSLEAAAEAALEFSRQGLSMEETLRRTNDALILTRLTGLKAADSVKGLTAAVNGFADAGLNTTEIINKLAAVDVKFAVGADDLINALARAGAVAQDAGVNFDQLVGAVTSAQQITARGGAVIGNSFKTIFTRIQRGSTLDALEEMGIAVRDIRGNTMPALTVLKNLSDSYNDLGASTKAAVAEQVGGVFQINVLKAALKDLNKENSLYSQATKISSQATDQAQRKNEQLQKTISALAAQTSLTLQELASNIGDLTLAPGISQILEAVNSFGEGLNNLFGKNSEGLGADFAKGIMRGVGSVLAGPGVVLAFGVFAKLFSNALKFAKSSLKDILGIVTAKDKERGIQESIVMAMSQNKQLAIELNKYSGDKTKQEQIMLGVIKEQTHFLRQQQKIASTIAPGLARAGVSQTLTMGKNSRSNAEGFIPNFSSSSVTPYEKAKEESMAAKAGYRSGQVKKMNMLGLGEVIYNTNESVKTFSGMKQPAIIPPKDSRAGSKYGSKFMNKHGFDPYSSVASASEGSSNNSTYHKGFVPNFALPARQTGTMLNLPKARMFVQHPRDRGWKKMESPLDNVAAKAARLKPMISELEKLGITALSRSFYFANQDTPGRTSGARKASDLGRSFSNDVVGSVYEEGLYNNKKSGLKGKGFIRTSNDAYKIKGKTATKKSGSGDGQGVVDFVRPGRLPIEAKHGYSPANLLAKSIFQASDTSVEEFLRKNSVNTSGFSSTKEARAVSTARKLRGYKGADISDALNLGLSGGFIPNFADDKVQTVKSISKIIDGDSIEADVLVGTQRVDHRLHGVDAVEKDQAYGTRGTSIAKNFYNNQKGKTRLRDRRVQDGKAAYGRGLFKDQELARSLVEKGYGVPDAGYLNKGDYFKYQKITETAKSKGVGIWRDKTPKGRYRHPKAKFYLHQQGVVQKADQWKDVTVGNTRFKGRGNTNLSNKKHKGYADGGNKFSYSGLIPNFADFRTREQKIQAVLSDPANKGIKFNNKLNNTKTFKTQARGGMFHSMYVESYLKTGNQSDLNYLVKVGYNKQELISLRRHKKSGGRVNVRGKGFVPNFLKTEEFSRTSRGASQFNSANGLDLQTALSGGKGFKLSKFNFDKVRQFLNSSQFRQLPENIQNQLLNKLKIQSKFVKMGDVTRPYLKGKTSFPGRIAASSGFIPNFSSPLEDAISREKAAGIPKSMMKIESDPSLVMPENPLGLGVTNTRDEPAGIKQGINRAISMGIDPKTHGSSNNSTYASGIIPNFAQTLGPATNESRERAGLGKRGKESGGGDMGDGGMGRLFALTTAAYALQGAFSNLEGETGKTIKVFTGLTQGITQGLMLSQAFTQIGQSGGKVSKALSKIGPLGAVIAGAIPIFSALKENYTFLDSGLDTLSKSAIKTSKTLDGLENAIRSAQEIEGTKNELTKLNNSTLGDTFEGELKKITLQSKQVKQQSELNKSVNAFGKEINLSSEQIELMTSGSAAGMKKLQEAQLLYAKKLQSVNLQKEALGSRELSAGSVLDNITKEGSLLENITSSISDALFANERTSSNRKVNQSRLDVAQIQQARAISSDESVFKAVQEMIAFGKTKVKDANGNMKAQSFSSIISENVKSGDPIKERAATQLGEMYDPSNAGASMFDIDTVMSYAEKFSNQNKEEEKLRESGLDLTIKINKRRAETLSSIERSNNLFKLKQKEISESNDYAAKVTSLEQSQLSAMGVTTKSMEVRAEIEARKTEISNEFKEKNRKAEQDALESIQKESTALFGKKNNPERTFSQLSKTVSIKGQEFTPDTDQAFSVNMKKLQDSLIKAHLSVLAGKLKEVRNVDEANQITNEHLASLKDYKNHSDELVLLQSSGVIPSEKNLLAELNSVLINKKDQNESDKKLNDIKKDAADIEGKLSEITKGTLASKKQILSDMMKDSEYSKKRLVVIRTDFETISANNKILSKQLDIEIGFLKTQEGIGIALDAEFSSRMLALDQSKKQLIIDTAIVQDKAKLQALVAEQVNQEEQKAVNARATEKATFEDKLKKDIFRKEGVRSIESNRESMRGEKENLQGQLSVYSSEGNSGRSSEVALELAQHEKELNFERGNGTLFADSLAVKIAEANVQMERFGETLANTAFDSVKDGFKGMLKDMGDSSKSVGDTILNFFGGIAGKIHDALVERAAAQITSGIFEMTGLSGAGGMYKGGMVSRYAAGGSTRSVPAMLTAGEVVVRKKVVDRLGKGSLDKINQSGSLEDLYDKPNQDNFEMFNSGGVVAPSIMRLKDGGSIDNYLAKRNKGTDRVSQNERTTVDGEIINSFTNTLAKFMGGMVKMNFGGEVLGGLQSSKNDTAGEKIAKGGGYLAGSSLAAYEGREEEEYQGPTAPKAPQKLNTNSTLDIDPTSRMMSARYRSQDQYSKDYGKYLLDKYQYDIDQKNAKVKGRAAMLQAIGGSAALAGGMALGNKMFNKKGPDMSDTLTEKDMNKKARNYKDYTVNGVTINGNYNNPNAGRTNYFNGGQVQSSNVNSIHMNKGGHVYSSVNSPTVNKMSSGGKVFGPNGIDKVGPVMLDRGEYVIKAASVNKVEKQYPGFFDQLNSMKMNQGGPVDSAPNITNNKSENNTSSESSSNVTININVSSSGETSVDGGAPDQQAMASRIKDVVVGVISQEKRVGGMLRGN